MRIFFLVRPVIIFYSNILKVSTLGQKANEFTILGADDYFGEAVLLKEDLLRHAFFVTLT